ncbi:hypothetical protein HOY82DRAFT_614096 [Tuber indicum]|nr:hypothetical protein HOY82DRAFT_614096 [Tuber indicum]
MELLEKARADGEVTIRHTFGTNRRGFERIVVGDTGFYVVLDKNLEKIFVLFLQSLKLVYSDTIGQHITQALCWNLEEFDKVAPPSPPKDQWHKDYENWLLNNPHLSWPPWEWAGVYHWGLWMELGHEDLGSVLNYSIGALTPTQRILLGAINRLWQQQYQLLRDQCDEDKQKFIATDEKEIFTLRDCLLNHFTEPNFDSKDIKRGWAVIGIQGEFKDGDFCITELKRRYVYGVGRTRFLRAERFKTFTMHWFIPLLRGAVSLRSGLYEYAGVE